MRTTQTPFEKSLDPVDERLPIRTLIIFGLQHVLVMAAAPITAAFLIGHTLGLSDDVTISLMSAIS